MDIITAKKVVALKRQKGLYQAMAKKGDITDEECKALVADLESQISRVRSQTTLDLAEKPKETKK